MCIAACEHVAVGCVCVCVCVCVWLHHFLHVMCIAACEHVAVCVCVCVLASLFACASQHMSMWLLALASLVCTYTIP